MGNVRIEFNAMASQGGSNAARTSVLVTLDRTKTQAFVRFEFSVGGSDLKIEMQAEDLKVVLRALE